MGQSKKPRSVQIEDLRASVVAKLASCQINSIDKTSTDYLGRLLNQAHEEGRMNSDEIVRDYFDQLNGGSIGDE